MTLNEKRKEVWEDENDLSEKGSFYYSEEDVKEFIKRLKEDIENAQEDYANLDWVSKDQIIEIINKRTGNLE